MACERAREVKDPLEKTHEMLEHASIGHYHYDASISTIYRNKCYNVLCSCFISNCWV